MNMKKLIMIIVAAALVALPAMAQSFSTQQAEQPNAVFQSTSSMMGSGSTYSANPTLNSDGTASYNGAAAPSGPRKAKMDVDFEGDKPNTPQDPSPLGDALIPLMLLALAYAGMRLFRKKRARTLE